MAKNWPYCYLDKCQIKGHRHLPVQRVPYIAFRRTMRPVVMVPLRFRGLRSA